MIIPRARSHEGGTLTIRIPRHLGDKEGGPIFSQPLMSPSPATPQSRIVGKSKSLTTSMDKLITPAPRPPSRNSSSRESSFAGSRGSTPSSVRSTTNVSRPPSRRSVHSIRSPRTPDRPAVDPDERAGKSGSPSGSEASLHSSHSVNSSTHSVNSSQSIHSAASSNTSVKSRTSGRSFIPGRSKIPTSVRASSEPPTLSPPSCKSPSKKMSKSGSTTTGQEACNDCSKKLQLPARKQSTSASLNSSSGDVRSNETNSPKNMSRKSTPSRSTPPCTPKSSNHRHSIGATPNKKPLPVFNSYMSLFQVQEKLKKGEVIEGVLRINPKSYEDAYISAPEGGMDIFIGGVRDRNTALHGDVVAVLINPPENWKILYYQLDAYLEQNLELKALVYKPLEPVISNSDNAFTSTLSSTIIQHVTNTENHIPDDVDVVVEEEKDPEEPPQHQSKEHQKKKKKKCRRGKRKLTQKEPGEPPVTEDAQPPPAQDDSVQVIVGSTDGEIMQIISCQSVEDAVQVISCPPVEDSVQIISCPSAEDVVTITRQSPDHRGVVIVPPDELSECDFTDDNESIGSLTLDVEEHLNLQGPAAAETIVNENDLGTRIEPPLLAEKAEISIPACTSFQSSKPISDAGNQKSRSQMKKRNRKRSKKNAQNNVKEVKDAPQPAAASVPVENVTFPPPRETSEERTEPNVYQIQRLPNWEKFVQKTAVVVHVLERKHPMVAAGILKMFADKNPHMALFSPFDCRIPRIKIQMHKCPPDFLNRSDDYAKKIFLAKISEWNDPKFAFGDLIRFVGQVGDIEAELEALLLENNVDTTAFPPEVLRELPTIPWTIPEEEIRDRTDLRNSIIFTVDPASARDLDDAVSCLPLPSGNFRVGVHIADVSYFIKPDTLLDKIAADRGNSFYLVHKVIPMLPQVLCENVCSLNPGEDRLTFSAIWELTPEGNIEGEWFGRTVIRSCTKLSYDHVQEIIEHPDQDFQTEKFPPVEGHSLSEICSIVRNLNNIAVQLRQKRNREGALRLNQVQLGFTLEPDSLTPNGIYVHETKESNKLIEEFMLLANIAVAQKIFATFPNVSVLRRHPPPHDVQIESVVKFFSIYGIHLNPSSSKTLNESIQKYVGSDPHSIARMQLIVNLCSKPMQYARYVCSATNQKPYFFHHYALNVPLYTHFTSPIRRYADIMVHRLLAAAIDPERYPLPSWKPKTVAQRADQCNDKKQAAKVIHEVNCNLFLSLFIRNAGEMVEKGMIIGVLDRSIDVMICRLGVIKRCYMEKLPLKSVHFVEEQQQKSLIIEWEADPTLNLPSHTQKLSYFDCVTVILRPFENDALKFNAFLARSDTSWS